MTIVGFAYLGVKNEQKTYLFFFDPATKRYVIRALDLSGEPTGNSLKKLKPNRLTFLENVAGKRSELLRLDALDDSAVEIDGSEAKFEVRLRNLLFVHDFLGHPTDVPMYFKVTSDATKQQGTRSLFAAKIRFELKSNGSSIRDSHLHNMGRSFGTQLSRLGTGLGDGGAPITERLFSSSADKVKLKYENEMHVGVLASDAQFNAPFSLYFSRELNVPASDAVRLDHAPLRVGIPSGTRIRLLQCQPPYWARTEGSEVSWLVAVEGIDDASIFKAWNSGVVEPHARYLASHRGDRPVSWLPRLQPAAAATGTWTAILRVVDEFPEAHLPKPAHLKVDGLVHLGLGSFAHLVVPAEKSHGKIEARATLRSILDTTGSPLALSLSIVAPAKLNLEKLAAARTRTAVRVDAAEATQPLPLISLAYDKPSTAAPLAEKRPDVRVRVGAFDLAFPGTVERGLLKAWFEPRPLTPPASPELDWVPRISLSVAAPISSFIAGSQDVPEVESIDATRRRPSPLLIPLSTAAATSDDLALEVTEHSFSEDRQQIRMEVRSVGGGVSGRDIVVLDTEPFFIARVAFPALEATDENNAIAVWHSDSVEGDAWQIVARRSGYELLLPPQAVGEAAVKHRAYDSGGNELPTPPTDVAVNKPADFRIGEPARLNLFTTWRREQRGYVEPPTNTRRLFGDASQRAPGAPLLDANFELLYGLRASVSGRPDLLVTELTADLGLLPAKLAALTPSWDLLFEPDGTRAKDFEDVRRGNASSSRPLEEYGAFRDGWSGIHESFARRLGVLSLNPVAALPSASIVDGVDFELRRKAEIRRPVSLPPTEKSPYDSHGRRAGVEVDDLLPGGADWGFESREIYESVWARGSDGGELAGVHFSPLGGWGYQKASFDNRKTSIISRTAMGRAHFYSLERVGRIGVFWNRAKHVIVYERTVLPSAQFGPVQHPHAGRPLLRKVREFVEILEPERRYPEDETSRIDRGPVAACRFRSTIIPVDSTWGQDLPGVGWSIPLWDPAVTNKHTYPKPQIDLELAADPENGAASASAPFSAPQQFRFFTSTRASDDDRTDRWAPIEGIDFIDRPQPAPPDDAFSGADGNLDATMAAPVPVEGGFADFTFILEPVVEQGANLLAERGSAKAISAVLKNVTMMRSIALPAADTAAGKLPFIVEAAKLQGEVQAVADDLVRRFEHLRDQKVDDVKDALQQEAARAGEALRTKFKEVLPFDETDPSKWKTDFGKFEAIFKDGPCEPIKQKARQAIGTTKERLLAELDTTNESGAAHKLLAEIKGLEISNDAAKAAAKEVLSPFFVRIRFLADGAGNVLTQFDSAVHEISVDSVDKEVGRTVARLRTEVKSASALGRSELFAALDGGKTQLLQVIESGLDQLVTKVEVRLPQAGKTLRAAHANARAKCISAIEAELGKVRKKIDAPAEELDKVIDQALTDLGSVISVDIRVFGEAVTVVAEDLAKPLGVLKKNLDTLNGAVNSAWINLETVIDSASPELVEAKVTDAIRKLRNDIAISMDSVAAASDTAVGSICAGLLGSKSFEGLADSLRGLLKHGLKWEELFKAGTVGEALAKLSEQALAVGSSLERFVDRAADGIKEDTKQALARIGSPTLGLLRAFGEAPRVPGLGFNRPDLAYYFDPLRATVLTTPVAALVDRVRTDLKALGMRLPTRELAERFIPHPRLAKLDVAQLFPDFAGIRLDRLLPALKVPESARDIVKLSHGGDRETRRGWVEARIDNLAIGTKAQLFDLGPVAVGLRDGRLTARTRLEAGLEGQVERNASGRIDGSWDLSFGGQTLVTFRDTPLSFDDRTGIRFDLRPDRVELASAVQFLDKFVKALGQDVGGLRLSTIKEGALPVGVEAMLDLVFPPMTYGTFGISGLWLNTGLQLRVYPEFEIRAYFGLGSSKAPFTITVFILGGAGWIQGAARYRPATGDMRVDLSIAIGASAAMGFDFGPVHGGVQLFFGINVELHTGGGRRATADFALVIIASGSVRVANLITVGLHLVLEARLQAGGRVTASGRVTYTIKLGFIKKSFSAGVSYKFTGGSSAAGLSAIGARPVAAATDWTAGAEKYLLTLDY